MGYKPTYTAEQFRHILAKSAIKLGDLGGRPPSTRDIKNADCSKYPKVVLGRSFACSVCKEPVSGYDDAVRHARESVYANRIEFGSGGVVNGVEPEVPDKVETVRFWRRAVRRLRGQRGDRTG